jgi:hypothetical protein
VERGGAHFGREGREGERGGERGRERERGGRESTLFSSFFLLLSQLSLSGTEPLSQIFT